MISVENFFRLAKGHRNQPVSDHETAGLSRTFGQTANKAANQSVTVQATAAATEHKFIKSQRIPYTRS
jgi:hypothetical protein